MLLKTKQEIKKFAQDVKKDIEIFLEKKHNTDYIMVSDDYEPLEYSLFKLLSVCLLDTSLFVYTNRIAAILIKEEPLLEYFLDIHTRSEIKAHLTQELFTTTSKYSEFLIN